jgi:ankyrin repeat protein
VIINLKHIQVNVNKFNNLNLSSALRSAMAAPPLEGKIGSLEALTAKGVPGDLTPESHRHLMNAAMVGPPKQFLELWAGVNLNSQAVWSSEPSEELKQKYTVDHPNHDKMDGVYAERALPAVQKGRTALHMAASNGQAEIVRYICTVPGINVNVKDEFGFTPLHLAAQSPDHDDQRVCVIKELLNVKNINPNSEMKCAHWVGSDFEVSRITALHLAVGCEFKEAVDLLLAWRPKQGDETISDVGVRWSWGHTPLHLAIRGEHFLIMDALIRFINTNWPEAINIPDLQGRTPLHVAVMRSNLWAVAKLLNQKAPLEADEKDRNGKTPFSTAMDKHDYPMVRLLQSYFERTSDKSKAYANAANAILVGAALLATVTFTAWLTLPVVGDSQLFWVFNSLCFYFAICTFLAAATASMPTKGPPLALAEPALAAASCCLACSIAFAVCAFATIGFTIIPQNIKYRRDVIGTTAFGGFLCWRYLIHFTRSLLGFSSELFFYLDFQFNALWERVIDVIKKPLMDTKLVKNASLWLNRHYIYGY